jgi:hypothetical protein
VFITVFITLFVTSFITLFVTGTRESNRQQTHVRRGSSTAANFVLQLRLHTREKFLGATMSLAKIG